jgi:hypothetical protein
MLDQHVRLNGKFIRNELIWKRLKTDIRCSICDNGYFKVERIAPEEIELTCENCGEVHKIAPDLFDKKLIYLKFYIPDI